MNNSQELYYVAKRFASLSRLKSKGFSVAHDLFALLTHQPIIFFGENKREVEQALSVLLSFYPRSSVTLWTEKPQDHLLVGTHLENFYLYNPKSALIIDLSNDRIKVDRKMYFVMN